MTGWRCECGDRNRDDEAFCYRCGACGPDDAADQATAREDADSERAFQYEKAEGLLPDFDGRVDR